MQAQGNVVVVPTIDDRLQERSNETSRQIATDQIVVAPINPPAVRGPVASLTEQTYARLRRTLILGQVRPGQQMTLSGLARQLGTSKTPLRDALSRLASADALQPRRETGLVVPILGPPELDELRRLRLTVERLAFATVAPIYRKADWRGFRLLHSDVCAEAEGTDAVRFASAVWTLRVALLGLAHSSVLAMFVDRIWCRLGPTFTQLAGDHDTRRHMALLLGDIVDAISQGDLERAERALVAEIDAMAMCRIAEADPELSAPSLVPSSGAGGTGPGQIQSGVDHV